MKIRNSSINFIISYFFINIFLSEVQSKSSYCNNKIIGKKPLKNFIYRKKRYNSSIPRLININKRILRELDKKCTKIDYTNQLCFECNTKEGYYPIYHDYNYDNRKILLKKYIKNSYDCYNRTNIPVGYFFNKDLLAYEKCYNSCKNCYGNGNRVYHNCSSCIDNYIFQPEVPNTTNCVPKCKYYYYYSFVGDYECTDNYYCPEKINIFSEKEKKCVSDCKYNNKYIYQYNGECLSKCPENTYPNTHNICIDFDIEKCSISVKNIDIDQNLLNDEYVDEMVKKYAKEFSYSQNHISQYKMENASIIFLKNLSCINNYELSFSNVVVEKEILENITYYYKFDFPPIIAIIDIIDYNNNPKTNFAFYEPNDGIKIDLSNFQNFSFIINKNISFLLKEEKYQWLLIQNIDLFNLSSSFYCNVCFHFESNNGRDVTLKDRIINYYPNISLCEDNCILEKLNYKNGIVLCKCNFTFFSNYFNFIIDDVKKKYYDSIFELYTQVSLMAESKILILLCNNNLFTLIYFIIAKY